MALTPAQKRKIKEEEEYRHSVITAVTPPTKQTYGLPALLSFFVPGLGQIIKGQVLKGIFCFFGVMFGLFFLVIPGIIIWIWQISDAYSSRV